MPAKLIFTFTSLARGSSISMVSVCHGPRSSLTMAALTCIHPPKEFVGFVAPTQTLLRELVELTSARERRYQEPRVPGATCVTPGHRGPGAPRGALRQRQERGTNRRTR